MSNRLLKPYIAICEVALSLVEKVRNHHEYYTKHSYRPLWRKLVFVLLTVFSTLLFRYILGLLIDIHTIYLLLIFPVILSAIYGGLVAGFLATLLSGILATYFFAFPVSTVFSEKMWATFLIFCAEGLVITVLIEALLYIQKRHFEHVKVLQQSEDRYRLVLDGMRDYSICILDKTGHIMSWNPAAERIMGYSSTEILGKHFSIFFPPSKENTFDRHNINLGIAEREGRFEDEGWRLRKDGSRLWANVIITPLRDEKGKVQGYVKMTRDITERKQFEDSIQYQASHDSLTDLPNRLALENQLDSSLKRAKRNKEMLAVLFLDLDRFKSINDSMGHNIGDVLLSKVADRLKKSIRDEDLVARFGGDEFIVLLPELRHPRDAVQVAQKIISTLRPAFSIEGSNVHINVSLGIAIYPHDGLDVQTLLKNADTALYQAKAAGRDMYKFYTKAMNQRASHRLNLETSIREALDEHQFSIAYQPLIDLKTSKIVGAEALIRWVHPKLGPIYPNDFIPIAEESGLILPIDEWVLAEVCRQIQEWNNEGIKGVKVAVNLSARQFSQPNLYEIVKKEIENNKIEPSQLELEITESMVMENIELTIEKLTSLQGLGVSGVIDDFGMGFSSLNVLKSLPIAKLKVDKTFVRHCTTDSRDEAIVKAIITMAHSLKMKVVAEGIEEKDHISFLRSLHCDWGQGYFISTPLSAEKFKMVMKKKQKIGT